ncbi:unnamed protein product [Withania somnifera]
MNILRRLLPTKFGFKTSKKLCYAPGICSTHSSLDCEVEVRSPEQEVIISLGSNVGNRLHNFDEALHLMKQSAPAYVTDQPQFLNSAVRGVTKLGPHKLLSVLRKIEKDLGRTTGIRYGPRPIDLDILFYGKFKIHSEILDVPHERIWERPFVVAPLIDLLGSEIDGDTVARWLSFSKHSGDLFKLWEKLGVGNQLWDWSLKTSLMGILNLTPDSFSDGGKHNISVEAAVSQVRLMLSEGTDMIDFGAQSTRPNATKISVEEELDRLIPVIEAITKIPEIEGKLLSVDTFYSEVASEAVKKGVHLVNDVSGGQLDSNMHSVVATLRVPYVAMHTRGDPFSMQNPKNLQYSNVYPGIEFSKMTEHNLDILNGLTTIRTEIARWSLALSHAPLLIGPSRKRFLGEVCALPSAGERDPATVAAVTTGILNGANVVRVHNVQYNADALRLCDALLERKHR